MSGDAQARHNAQPTPPTLAEADLRSAIERLATGWEAAALANDTACPDGLCGNCTQGNLSQILKMVLAQHPAERVTGVELHCDDCQQPYATWYAGNAVWNLVMGGPEQADDPGGMLCPRCFALRAEKVYEIPIWHLRLDRVNRELVPPERPEPEGLAAKLRELHEPARVLVHADQCDDENHNHDYGTVGDLLCFDCPSIGTYCVACTHDTDSDLVTYPCPTIALLDASDTGVGGDRG